MRVPVYVCVLYVCHSLTHVNKLTCHVESRQPRIVHYQAWCVESDSEIETVRLKLFFMDLQSVPRNHIRYISWIAYVVRRDSKSGSMKESMAVKNSPHCNYYLQDGIDMGTIMDTHIPVKEVSTAFTCLCLPARTRVSPLFVSRQTVYKPVCLSIRVFRLGLRRRRPNQLNKSDAATSPTRQTSHGL